MYSHGMCIQVCFPSVGPRTVNVYPGQVWLCEFVHVERLGNSARPPCRCAIEQAQPWLVVQGWGGFILCFPILCWGMRNMRLMLLQFRSTCMLTVRSAFAGTPRVYCMKHHHDCRQHDVVLTSTTLAARQSILHFQSPLVLQSLSLAYTQLPIGFKRRQIQAQAVFP